MLSTNPHPNLGAAVPPRAGIGLRPPHYRQVLSETPPTGWFEVHSENYFGDGGQPLHYLAQVRASYPLSLHGVGLCLGATDRPDRAHLQRLAALIRRFEPGLVSEHLSWGRIGDRYLNDLLPLPYTEESLAIVCEHVEEVQDYLQQQLLVENITSYLRFSHSTIAEPEFIAALVARTGCGILLDVNNIYVNAVNHGTDASGYIDAIPVGAVNEIHLAGFDHSGGMLIDTHGQRVAEPVWSLYRHALARFRPVPTLIEWDTDIPPLEVLLEEARRADQMLETDDAFIA
ncbi:MNIO family bufferin maturase [Cupriavidus sp. CP313]